ncbi:MAG: carboxypeptidase M32 [Thermoplasmata archaeon]
MDPKIKDILKDYEKIWALNQANSLLNWDLETYMPKNGVEARGLAIANISLLRQTFFLELSKKVSSVKIDKLDETEAGIVRTLNRTIHYYTSIPPEIIEKFETLTSKATVVWREAKSKSDFSLFRKYLNDIVEINVIIAEKLGYEDNIYDPLMDLYEEGFTVRDADSVFDRLLSGSREIYNRIIEENIFSTPSRLEKIKYREKDMIQVNKKIIELLEMPPDRFRIDVSSHPFTTEISEDDVRITTRYEGYNFKATLFSTIHESGHAIYQLQIPSKFSRMPIARGVSSGIHESQSRFWENFIGRSKEFVHFIYPVLKYNLPFLKNYTEDRIYRYFNTVRPSLIRVDADEVTYNFHIALRYEIEKKLINSEIDVKEVPELWNDFMEKYIGIRPKNDSEGVLQDIHWSGGSFGYFPTYSLGNIVAGMIWGKHDFTGELDNMDIKAIKLHLYEKVHKYGSIYEPKKLLMKSFGETYNPDYLLAYLKKKFLS